MSGADADGGERERAATASARQRSQPARASVPEASAATGSAHPRAATAAPATGSASARRRSPLDVARRALATAELGPRSKQELEAVLAALVAAVVAFVAALLTLMAFDRRTHPISGPGSIGTVAGVAAAVSAATSFAIAYLRSTDPASLAADRRFGRVIRGLAAVALTLVCVGFAYIAVQTLALVFQQGFVGLELDGLAGSLAVALAAAGAAYLAHPLGEQIDTRVLGTLVPAFLVVGVLFSMLTASDPEWWQLHFSSLGAGGGISGFAFNMTLVVSGLMVATMAAYIGHDLEHVTDAGPRVAWVGRLLAGVGVLMMLVGIVRVDLAEWLHVVFASGMVVVFCGLCIALPWLAPRLPRAVHVASGVLVAGTIGALVLWVPIGYYNFTGFEFAACGLIFVWLTTFLRAVAAAAGDRREDAARTGSVPVL